MLFLGFICGACWASFCGCLAYRLPLHLNLGGRSCCDHCARQLRWFELIPILSYLLLRGHCRACQTKINPALIIGECLSGLFALKLTQIFLWQPLPLFIHSLLWFGCLIFLSYLDYYTQFIYPALLLPLIIHRFTIITTTQILISQLLLAGCCFMALIIISQNGRLLGFGDIELLTVIAFCFDLNYLLHILLFGSGIALIFILFHHNKATKKHLPIPFVPFITLGFYLAQF
ncbi:prepilin peptidase [Agrilactobacillus fermenti]|uniref:prepilin peptidase n=1 Tax=Agrilactobacillus fermenti TaxID=2586909 RepID=UPI001E48BD04|nr:A24 family peptidase [Agrilactobacillus fermenti]MCD2257306.1 prepilin peptidase [Agrilactobacillus fermenti]